MEILVRERRWMPKGTGLQGILILGSWLIVIRQAAELEWHAGE